MSGTGRPGPLNLAYARMVRLHRYAQGGRCIAGAAVLDLQFRPEGNATRIFFKILTYFKIYF
jgi:hypothetical protein